MTKSNTLSRTAQAVLADAAAREDHIALPPEHLPTAARRAVVQSLLKGGLLEEVAADDDGPAWRTTNDGERLALCVTAMGLAAAGNTATQDDTSGGDLPVTEPTPSSASEDQQPPEPQPTTLASTVEPTAAVRLGVRAAAQAILAVWDDANASRPDLPTAVEALRAALASRLAVRTPATPGTPRQPRTDTKRAIVLAMLCRPEGATVAQVVDATGWAPHTMCGFFAGLKKAGTPVDVLERVRQVGPGKEGAKGSYTVYRVAEAG